MNVSVGHNEARACFFVLETTYDSDVILAKNPVEHVIRLLEVWALHGYGAKLD